MSEMGERQTETIIIIEHVVKRYQQTTRKRWRRRHMTESIMTSRNKGNEMDIKNYIKEKKGEKARCGEWR